MLHFLDYSGEVKVRKIPPCLYLKNKMKLCLLLLLGSVLLSGCSGFKPLPANTSPSEREHYLKLHIDQLLEAQLEASQPGISVLVLKDNQVVYQRSKGLANLKQNIAITSDTVFNIASLTKPITAVAIMQLAEKHRLTLEDSVLKWLPQLPSNWKDIQIQHLLTHQSGIPFCFTTFQRNTISEFDGMDNETLIDRYITNDPLLFPPGSSAKYCNIDYVLLAEIIVKASGISYADYVTENVFIPLGMRSSYVYSQQSSHNVAVALNYGRTSQIYGMNFAVTGALGVFSSAADLSKFATGLLTGKLIQKETLQQMISDQLNAESFWPDSYFGYGWFLYRSRQQHDVFYHPGDADGFTSMLLMNYQQRYVVIALSNNAKRTTSLINEITTIVQEAYYY